eukprot:1177931-Prorocentrum_minimum.AAC.1
MLRALRVLPLRQRRDRILQAGAGPIRRGERAQTRRVDQSDEGRGHIPAGWTNRTREEGIYLQAGAEQLPLAAARNVPREELRVDGVLPAGRWTNQTRGEGIYPQGGPIG